MGKLISWVARFRNVVKLNERRVLKKKNCWRRNYAR